MLMRTRAAGWLAVLIFLAGCFTADVTVKSDGSGVIKVSYDAVVKTTEESERRALAGPGITIESLAVQEKAGAEGKATSMVDATLAVADITKVNAAARFRKFDVKIADAGEGKKRLEATIKNLKTAQNWTRTDPCTIRVHLPGEVVETSATKQGTGTVVWTFPSTDYFKEGEVKMTAVYKVAGAAPAAAAQPMGEQKAPEAGQKAHEGMPAAPEKK
jgi:hypothetical protein